jgi:hypothetical protein
LVINDVAGVAPFSTSHIFCSSPWAAVIVH